MNRIFQETPIKGLREIFIFSRNTFFFSSLYKLNSLKEQEFGHTDRKEKWMKRLSLGVAILLSLLMINTIAEAQGTPKVLLIAIDMKSEDIELMFVKEVGVMIDMLQKAGFKVVVANISGNTIEGPVSRLKPDMKLSAVKVDDYAGFILPCMAPAFSSAREAPAAVSIVKQAFAKRKPLAAVHDSIYILAEAGVLNGKRYSFIRDPSQGYWLRGGGQPTTLDLRFGRATYSGSGVVQDGNIITSGVCPRLEAQLGVPDRTIELTQAFIKKLSQKDGN